MAARAVREPVLLARALVALGSAMIHGVRGADQEGLALLHEAVPLVEATDDGALAVTARREIGYVDFLRGRYDRALHWFDHARLISDSATTEVGWVDLYAGSSRDDVGAGSDAAQLLDRALRTAFVLGEQVGDPCWESAALRSLGLVTVDEGDVGRGVTLLRDAPVQCRRLPDTYRWIELLGTRRARRRCSAPRSTPSARMQLESQASAHGMRPFAQRARRASTV